MKRAGDNPKVIGIVEKIHNYFRMPCGLQSDRESSWQLFSSPRRPYLPAGAGKAVGDYPAEAAALLMYSINAAAGRMSGAAVTEREPVGRILHHIGVPDCAPEVSPARGPPDFSLELDQCQVWDVDAVDSAPEFEYDQTVNW
ncbi:MAG: hypothetical protein ABW168_13290 [Sedimenticola sp.]